MGKVTISDIANMSKVSKSSVSRYLNGGYVSEENKIKIADAIKKTGYEENFFAKRLKTKRSNLIGVVLPRIDSVTVGKLLGGINQVLKESGLTPLLIISEQNCENELKAIQSLHQQGVDGIIVESVGITKEHIELISRISTPVIFTGQKNDYVDCMIIDDYAAGQIMGNYFYNAKHRNIVFLGVSEEDDAVGVQRKKGFYDAFAKHESDATIHFVETDFSFINAYEKGKEVLEYHPTAVVCATDNLCLGLMRYFYEQKIAIPQEISIAGFGGYDVSSVMMPPLTTIAFNYELLGIKTAEALLELIDGKKLNQENEIPLKLIERASVRILEDK